MGEGSNEAVIAINWGVPDTALAWGLRFNGDLTVTTALQTLVAADDRLTTDAAMSTFHYADSATTLSFQNETGNYMQFILNGNSQASLSSVVSDGDFLKVGESAYGVGYDSTAFAGQWYPMGVAWPTPIHPVSVPDTGTTPIDTVPIPEEATIAFSDILYWVGEGSNEAVMAVNWVDTALAWGYRWNGTATVGDMMAHIAAADPRFSYTGTGMVSDINYIDTAAGMTTPLGITPGNWWSSTNNGVMDMGMSQTLSNGDFEKWADSSTGILVDSVWMEEYGGYWNYIYVYPMTIHPVTVPDTTTIQDGIDTHEMPQVFAYPNPCNGTLYIINENAERVELYNVNGQLLEMVNSGDTHITLNMQAYPAGLYMLKVGNGVQKILKK